MFGNILLRIVAVFCASGLGVIGAGSMGISETKQGTIFTITPVPASGTQGALTSVITRYATLTIIGNETGGFITIPITVQLPIGGLGSSTS